ncbi:hypothetical protein ACKWTF_003576 [Chironomus riparius]
MKHFLVLCLVIVAALAAPQEEVSVLRSDSSADQAGYSFTFEQSDGQKRDETGEVKNAGEENESIAVRGSFSFTAPDGQTYTVNYVADEGGFRPEASHIPV